MSEEKSNATAAISPASFIDRLAQASAEVGHIEKRGRNEFQKYNYVTAVDISARAVVCMAKYHIGFGAETLEMVDTEGKTRNGNPETICRVKMEYTFEDGLSDAKRVVHFHGEGRDSGEKSAYKAMTGALKYALIQNLLIPTGDDPEDDKEADSGRKGAPDKKTAATPPAATDAPAGAAAGEPQAQSEPLPPLSDALVAQRAQELAKLLEASGTEMDKITHHYGVASIEDIARSDKHFDDAKALLEKKIAKAAKK